MTALPTPPGSLHARQRTRDARAALVALWEALEALTGSEAHDFLSGTGAAFLPGLDVPATLDALARDHARRHLTGGGA